MGRNKKKRIISMILSVVMIVTTVPLSTITALATSSGDYVYEGNYAYNTVTHHSYEAVTTLADYETAKAEAEKKGGYLAVPNSEEENVFYNTFTNTVKQSTYWIGVYGSSDGTKWECADDSDFALASMINRIENTLSSANALEFSARNYSGNNFFYSSLKSSSNDYLIEYDECQHSVTEIKDATYDCTQGGYTGDTYCTLCGEKTATGETLAASDTEHSYQIIGAKDATCFLQGYTGDSMCQNEHCIVGTEGEETPRLAHNYDSNGVCTLCGSVLANDFGTYSTDFSKASLVVTEYTPTVNVKTSFYSSEKGEHRDTYAYLYDDKDKCYDSISKYLNDRVHDKNVCFTNYLTYNDDDNGNSQPKITYSLTAGTKYYYVLMSYAYIQQPSADYKYDIGIECSHENTHKVAGTVTCTQAGVTDTKVCDVCGETISGGEPAEAYGHGENAVTEIVGKTSPGCTTEGYTGDERCVFCHETLNEGTAIPANHSVYTNGGYTEAGLNAVNIHTYQANEATCFQGAYTTDYVKCDTCGEVLSDTPFTPKSAHILDNDGYCTACGIMPIGENKTAIDVTLSMENQYRVFEYTPSNDESITFTSKKQGDSKDTYGYVYTDAAKLESVLNNLKNNSFNRSYFIGYDMVDDDGGTAIGNSSQPKITFDATAGTTYYFVLCTYNAIENNTHNYSFDITLGCTHSTTHTLKGTATCKKAGTTDAVVCDACGLIIRGGQQIEAYGHGENAKTVLTGVKNPTCIKAGYTGDTCCVFCNEVIEAGKAIPSIHSMYGNDTYSEEDLEKVGIYSIPAIEATCWLDGTSEHDICSKCNTVLSGKTVTTPHLEHSFDDNGVCTKCGYHKDVQMNTQINIDMINEINVVYDGYKNTEVFNVISFTPKSDGGVSFIYNSNERIYVFDSEKDLRSALNTGDLSYANDLNSTEVKANVTYYALYMIPGNLDLENPSTAIAGINCNHSSYSTVRGTATCVDSENPHGGTTPKIVCDCCGDTLVESTVVTEPLKHIGINNSEVRNKTEATCTENGYSGDYYCLDCGKMIAEGETIYAYHNTDQHDEVDYDVRGGISATCVRAGKEDDWYCNECGQMVKDGAVIPKLTEGHSFQEGYCENCGIPEDFLECDSDGYYLVNNADDFETLMEYLDSDMCQCNIDVRLTGDIDLSNYTHLSEAILKNGTFDGNGHRIYNFNTTNTGKMEYLFKTIDNAVIKDFTITGNLSANEECAMIVESVNDSTFENITVNGSIESDIENFYDAAGFAIEANDTTFINCVNNANLKGYYVGGLIAVCSNCVFTNCVNNGTIAGIFYAGGIVSDDCDSKFYNCANHGDINIEACYAGGIVGYEFINISAVIDSCTNSGNIVAGTLYAGGIIGYVSNGINKKIIINNCTNTGNIDAVKYVGGVVGIAPAVEITSSYNSGDVSALDYVGGIAGTVGKGSQIADCNSLGTVNSTGANVSNIVGSRNDESTIVEHKHTYKQTAYVAPTCTRVGSRTYTCKCGHSYKVTIKASGHKNKTTITKATTSRNGSIVTKCTVCRKTISTKTIYAPKTYTLSTTSYTYNGKVKKPSIVIKDSKGKTISSSNYTVSYASGRKNVGKYAVKVTFKGNYSGTKTVYFTIKPKTTSIKSVLAGSKSFTVKWSKQASQVTGYQIQYSTSISFRSATTKTITKNSTTSYKKSKLKAKKKYYVRVRTYKTVGKTKYYSSWSKAKTVKTK